jgi:hypothetical protein
VLNFTDELYYLATNGLLGVGGYLELLTRPAAHLALTVKRNWGLIPPR